MSAPLMMALARRLHHAARSGSAALTLVQQQCGGSLASQLSEGVRPPNPLLRSGVHSSPSRAASSTHARARPLLCLFVCACRVRARRHPPPKDTPSSSPSSGTRTRWPAAPSHPPPRFPPPLPRAACSAAAPLLRAAAGPTQCRASARYPRSSSARCARVGAARPEGAAPCRSGLRNPHRSTPVGAAVQVMRIEELAGKSGQEVAQIWLAYHAGGNDKASAGRAGAVYSAEDWALLQERAKKRYASSGPRPTCTHAHMAEEYSFVELPAARCLCCRWPSRAAT